MISFGFEFNGEICFTNDIVWDTMVTASGESWLNDSSYKKNGFTGKTIDIEFPNGTIWKGRGYLMIAPNDCYVDVCEDKEIDEFESVIEHCPIIMTKMNGYDQTFVEQFHPNYNCDKIAWLNDAYCALDNEVENDSHWSWLAHEINLPDTLVDLCEMRYESSFNDFFSYSDFVDSIRAIGFDREECFGKFIARVYGDEIENIIYDYEGEIMEEAINEFEYLFGIEEI